MTDESQPPRETQIDRNRRQPSPAVSARTGADDRAVDLAAKLASGTAEALGLDGEPARRLATIAVEGTRNAVEHAYAGRSGGDVEIEIARRRDDDALVVRIRDFGAGCPLAPTTSEPPGLGLSIISGLSEALQISSQRGAGTTIEATIRLADGGGAARDRSARSRGSRLTIHDSACLATVIPRVISVHAAAAGGGSVDAVRAAIDGGRRLADAIGPDGCAGRAATLAIEPAEAAGVLAVRVGPMPVAAAAGLRERLGSAAALVSDDELPGKRCVQVSFSLL